MNVREYYRYIRGLAPYRAADALDMARKAAAADQRAADAKRVPFVDVWAEDGIRMSRAVRVY